MSRMLFNKHPILISPEFAAIIGLDNAIVIQQIHYWLVETTHWYDEKPWVYNSYTEWQKQFPFWSARHIGKILRDMENKNLIESGMFNKLALDRTKWYTIDYGKLDKVAEQIDEKFPQRPIAPKASTIVPKMDNHDT